MPCRVEGIGVPVRSRELVRSRRRKGEDERERPLPDKVHPVLACLRTEQISFERDTSLSCRYAESRNRVRQWLSERFGEDGRFVEAPDHGGAYFKAPYLAAACGDRSLGARIARFVSERLVDGDGEYRVDMPLENRIYAMGWLALGAAVTERYELASAMAEALERRQDPGCGGIVLPDDDAGEEVAEVCFSGGAGMGLIAAGRTTAARRMADGFVALLEAQPETGRFYNRYRRDGTVVSRPAGGGWDKCYDSTEDEQRPATLATVVNTLVWVGRAAREPSYFETAARYVDLVYGHRLDPARFGRATKFGWAMLNLYADTGDPRLVERARALGEVLLERQETDGLWSPRPGDHRDAPTPVRLSYSSDCAMTICALDGLQ